MRFVEPYWLLVGAVAVVSLLALRIRAERLTMRAIAALTFSHVLDTRTLPSRFVRRARILLACVAVAAAFVALARPQKGLSWETLDRHGTDLLLAIDTSKSMDADDVSPTRLERTKLAVRDLVEHFPEDRVGLLAFAGDAVLESPLTLDHGALLETLGAFDSSLVSRPGTDVGRAIDTATAVLKSDSGSQKILVVVTDGEELEGNGLKAAERAAAAGITIETLGVGTPAGDLVPAKDERGATVGVLRDQQGEPVRSRLNEPGLKAIAEAAHGSYRPLGADGSGLERLYAETLAPLAHTEHGARVRRVYAEWFAVPLGVALGSLLLEALLAWAPRRRPRPAARTDAKAPLPGARSDAKMTRASQPGGSGRVTPQGSARSVAAAALVLFTVVAGRANASPQSAENAYAAGHFEQSAREYESERARHPEDARLAIDAGVAAYRARHYDSAEAALSKALAVPDPKLRERVLYDLGDARYRLGEATQKAAPERTIERWKSSLSAYEDALKLTPSDADARFNRDFVKRKLAELENQQKTPPPQPQPDPKKNQGSGKSSKDQDGKSPGQNGKSPGQSQNGKSPGQSQDGKSPGADASQQNGKNGAEGKPTPQPGQGQSPSNSTPPAAGGESASAAAERGENGRLSAADARALLGSLRGEERHVAAAGNGATPRGEDAPQKDW